MKSRRHSKIIELISENPVTKQEQIVDGLLKAGFNVTQATVSRDIKELRLVKVLVGNEYQYSVSFPNKTNAHIIPKYVAIVKETIKGVEAVGNLVVVTCHSGMASAAAESIDVSEMPGIAGTIAGDNMFLVILRSIEDASIFVKELGELING